MPAPYTTQDLLNAENYGDKDLDGAGDVSVVNYIFTIGIV